MELDIKYYIDFKKLFVDLYNLHESYLMQHRADNKVYMDIINFYEKNSSDFDICNDECEIDDFNIIFVFGYDFNDANESCTQSTTANYVIVFDKSIDEFSECNYEQG